MKKLLSMALALVMVLAIAATSVSAAINTAQLEYDVKNQISKGVKTATNRIPAQSADGYWSSHFSKDGQTAFARFVDAVKDFKAEVTIPDCDENERKQFAQILQQEHPELFYVDKIGYKMHQDEDGYKWRTMTITYQADAKNKLAEVKSAANKILSGAPKNGSDYDKELYIHDRLIKDTDYQTKKKTIYNNLVEHKSNCMGYAYAMKYLLNQLGVTCRVIIGSATGEGDHMWNVVTLNGKEYLTDTGWDDPTGTQYMTSYRYFNLTRSEMNRDHTPKNANEDSACTNSDQSYYKKNGMYYDSVEAAEAAIKKQGASGKPVAVQLPTNEMAQQVKSDFMGGKVLQNGSLQVESSKTQNKLAGNVVVVKYTAK